MNGFGSTPLAARAAVGYVVAVNRSAGTVMTRAPKTISPDALASEALEQLNSLKITSLFAIDGEQHRGCFRRAHSVRVSRTALKGLSSRPEWLQQRQQASGW